MDGPGFALVLWFTLTPAAREQLRQSKACVLFISKFNGESPLSLWICLFLCAKEDPSKTPAAKLLKDFVDAEDKSKMRGRLKAIPHLLNSEECDEFDMFTKKLLTSYNAKPFMTGPKYHNFYKSNMYIECDVDVHRYIYPARKAAHSFIGAMKNLKIDLSVVIQVCVLLIELKFLSGEMLVFRMLMFFAEEDAPPGRVG